MKRPTQARATASRICARCRPGRGTGFRDPGPFPIRRQTPALRYRCGRGDSTLHARNTPAIVVPGEEPGSETRDLFPSGDRPRLYAIAAAGVTAHFMRATHRLLSSRARNRVPRPGTFSHPATDPGSTLSLRPGGQHISCARSIALATLSRRQERVLSRQPDGHLRPGLRSGYGTGTPPATGSPPWTAPCAGASSSAATGPGGRP